MLLNMSANKRCHHHLANRQVVGFMMTIFQKYIFETFNSSAENDALYRTMKSLLYIFSRLIGAALMCRDLCEQMVLPIMQQAEQQLCECVRTEHRVGILKYLQNFNANFGRANLSKLSSNISMQMERSYADGGRSKDAKTTLV